MILEGKKSLVQWDSKRRNIRSTVDVSKCHYYFPHSSPEFIKAKYLATTIEYQ
jgi:hypothetical protein